MPFRVSPEDRKVIKPEVQKILDENIKEPSKSPCVSLVVLVTKKIFFF